jgi:carbamoyl-phosphate synthase large subunit
VLVLRAGTGPSNNLIRSLRVGEPSLFIAGCHSDRFVLRKSPADRNYLVPAPTHPRFLDALRWIIATDRIDLLVPNSDTDVRAVSDLRDQIPCRLFLPSREAIELCQDKYRLTVFLRERGLPAPLTYPVTDLDGIDGLFQRLAPHSRLWCRIRSGSSSTGAIPVTTPEQARSWIQYWETMRGFPATAFTISEYLPGRDYSLQCVWKAGSMVLTKMSERLSYFGGGNSPSGVSSTPALARTVFEPRVVEVCTAAIRAVDPAASGVFCFDLKENADGEPCVTEINAGRFAMITNIYDFTGKHNMAAAYVRLALDEPVDIGAACDIAEEYYLVRDLDTLPGVFHADELFNGILDARAAVTPPADSNKGAVPWPTRRATRRAKNSSTKSSSPSMGRSTRPPGRSSSNASKPASRASGAGSA